MWMFGSRTTVKKVRNSLTSFSHGSGASLLWGALDLRHVFRSKKVLVFNAMEDITNDEYLARS